MKANRWLPFIFACFPLAFAQAVPRNLVPIYDARLNFQPNKPTKPETIILRRDVLPLARTYWKRQKVDCQDSEYFDARDVANGAFTKPRSHQRAILYTYCQTGDMMLYSGIAILERNQLVANLPFEGNDYKIGAFPDLNGNGLSEIITANGFVHMGFEEENIAVFETPKGKPQYLLTLKTSAGNCSGGYDQTGKRESKAARVYAERGKVLKFYAELFEDTNACLEKQNQKWQKIKEIKRLSGDPYELLPAL